MTFARALEFSTFEARVIPLNRRLTLLVRDGVIEGVFSPVFPPYESSGEVAEWLENEAPESKRSPQ